MGALRQRVLAAAVLAPAVVAGVLWLPNAGFALMFAAFALVGAAEWGRVGELPASARAPFAAVLGLSLAALYALRLDAVAVTLVLAAALGYWAVALLWVARYQRDGRVAALDAAPVRAAAGWLTLAPSWLALVVLHAESPLLVLFVLLLIWAADSAAYFAGRRFGRRRLAGRVSPGKTWEGVAGGMLGVAVLAIAAGLWRGLDAGAGAGFVLLALAVGAASVLGDLAESLFKRRAGVKDSGTLIPGHGGVLDRIDSLTAAAPCFAAGWLAAGGAT